MDNENLKKIITQDRIKNKTDKFYSVYEPVTGIPLILNGKPTKYYLDNYINKEKNDNRQ